MLTAGAAIMVGAEVILTAIAQPLVKLNVDLRTLTTRGTLRAGVSEAFRRFGQHVVAQNGQSGQSRKMAL